METKKKPITLLINCSSVTGKNNEWTHFLAELLRLLCDECLIDGNALEAADVNRSFA